MTGTPTRAPTEAEAMRAAGAIYGRILADPERREQLRAARAARCTTENVPAGSVPTPEPAGDTPTVNP